MASHYKISCVVHPLVETGSVVKFAEIAAPDSNVAQLWRQIEARYKKNYLAQSHQNSFAIKKLQDEDGNDLDIFFKLSDVFAEAGKKVINVIQAHIDRDVSIPITSHLRPAEAFRSPLPPLFDANPHLNLDPDRPVSSTEREIVEDEDELEAGDRHGNNGYSNGAVGGDVHLPQHPSDESYQHVEAASWVPAAVKSSLHDGDHEADDENDDEGSVLHHSSAHASNQDSVRKTRNTASSPLLPPPRPSAGPFAKPALPAVRVQSRRPGQLSSAGKSLSGAVPRSVSKSGVRASVRAASPRSSMLRYNPKDPFEVPESEELSPETPQMNRNVRQKLNDASSRDAFPDRRSANAHASSNVMSAFTPPTSNEGLPLLDQHRASSRPGDLSNANANAVSADHDSSYLPETVPGRAATPATAFKNLTRVQSRTTSGKSRMNDLAIPTTSQAPKLLSPFQPAPQTISNDAPSFTTDDAAGSQASDIGRTNQMIGVKALQATPWNVFAPASSSVNALPEDIEDSMNEDIFQPVGPRRHGSSTSKQAATELSAPNIVPSSSVPSQAQAKTPIQTAKSASKNTNKKVPASYKNPRSSSNTLQPGHDVAVPNHVQEQTPAASSTKASASKKGSKKQTPGSIAPRCRVACQACRDAKRRCTHNVDGSASAIPLALAPTPSRAHKFTAKELEYVRALSSSAIDESVDRIAQPTEREADADVDMEDVEDRGTSLAKELPVSSKVTPKPRTAQPSGLEVSETTDADQVLQDKVREVRNAKTLTWLREQQEEARRSQAASSAEKQTQKRRSEMRGSESPVLTKSLQQKTDRKGKGRALHDEDDRALLRSAGFSTSDDVVEDLEDAADINHVSPNRQQLNRNSPRFSVVIDVPSTTVDVQASPAPSPQALKTPGSTQLDSHGLPTSAQPDRTTHRSSVSQPSSVPRVDTTPASKAPPRKLKPSEELFAFLPDKPSPEPVVKRKRKAPDSSPPQTLAAEFRSQKPEPKKRKTETNLRLSKTPVRPSVSAKGSSPMQAIVVQSDEEGRRLPVESPSSVKKKSITALTQKTPVIVLDNASGSSSRTRGASTPVSGLQQQPIVVESDVELLNKNTVPLHESRRSASVHTRSPEIPKSASLNRPRSSREPSSTVMLDGSARSPVRSVTRAENGSSGNIASTPRRPSAPSRPSAQLINQLRKDAAEDFDQTSTSDESDDDDVSMADAEEDRQTPKLTLPNGTTSTLQTNTADAGHDSVTGSEELELHLQSSAQEGYELEESRKSEVAEDAANSPSQSREPAQSQDRMLMPPPASVQISQTSTTRSPESSIARSERESSPPLPTHRRRSSSPDWLTPQWVRDKEEFQARKAEEERLAAQSQTTPTKRNGSVYKSQSTPPSAQRVDGSPVTKKIEKSPVRASVGTESSSSGSESASDEDDHEDEEMTDTKPSAQTSKPSQTPAPPVSSSAVIPPTPLKSALRKSSSSLSSSSNRNKQVDFSTDGGPSAPTARAVPPTPKAVPTSQTTSQAASSSKAMPPPPIPSQTRKPATQPNGSSSQSTQNRPPAKQTQPPPPPSSSDASSSPEPQPRFRTDFAPSASQPAPRTNNSTSFSSKPTSATRPTAASSPLRKPLPNTIKPGSNSHSKDKDQDSDSDTTSSDESGESGYSRESDVPSEVEREVARRMAANPRGKIGAIRQLVKFDQRMARRTKRSEDAANAASRKRTQDLRDMLRNAGVEGPAVAGRR